MRSGDKYGDGIDLADAGAEATATTVTLEDLVEAATEAEQTATVFLALIDIQGIEADVLQASAPLLRSHRVRNFIVGVHDASCAPTLAER